MTSDRSPELDFIPSSGAGGAWDASRNLHAASNWPGHRLFQPVRGDVSQSVVERIPLTPGLLDQAVEMRDGIMMPVLQNDDLEVFAFTLNVEQDIIRGMGLCLDEAERRRAERLRLKRDRRRFVATRGHLRYLLASKLGISPSGIELENGRSGKPHLSRGMPAHDLRFSISRSADVAVIALSTAQEVGVDIEVVLPVPEADEIAALCFSGSEYESYAALDPEDRLEGFLPRWTGLEAISKALGCGLGQSLSWDEKDWVVREFVPRRGYIGSVVVRK